MRKPALLLLPLVLAACANPNLHASAAKVAATPQPSATAVPAAAVASPSPTVASLALGSPLSVAGASNAVIAQVTVTSYGRASTVPLTAYASGPANGFFVTFTVQMVAEAQDTTAYVADPSNFYVLENGTHYDQMSGNAFENVPHPSLQFTQLAPGENISGNITFDVPAPHGLLAYAPNYNGLPIAEWSF